MISIALMLVLMIGINQVFKATGQAIGAGNAVASIARDARESSTNIFDDLNHVSPDCPMFFINETAVAQYKNQADYASNAYGPQPLNRTDVGKTVSLLMDPDRGHYASTMGFFASGNFTRHTAPDGYVAPLSNGAAQDAFVWYGHVAQPLNSVIASGNPTNDNPPNYNGPQDFIPGFDPNSAQGYFAADWVLGRQVTLLSGGAEASVQAKDPGLQFQPTAALQGTPAPYGGTPPNVTPLGYDVQVPVAFSSPPTGSQFPNWVSEQSRCDMGAATLDQMRNRIRDAYIADSNSAGILTAPWWTPFVFTVGPTNWQGLMASGGPIAWQQVPSRPASYLPVFRYEINTLYQPPVDATAMARITPYLMAHASQFIVEYAGDYVQQNPAGGALTGAGPDGQLDYFYDATGTKRIRWYGLPRYDAAVPHTSATIAGGGLGLNGYFPDVIPLRDFLYMMSPFGNGTSPGYYTLPFSPEKYVSFPVAADYAAAFTSPNYVAGTTGDPMYTCVWTNNTPWMIRILVKVDDPNGQLQGGPWFEYIFTLRK
jgi:hypothetical protein